MPEWLQLCLSKSVIKRALLSALVVGTILITINQGDAILQMRKSPPSVSKSA